MRRYTLIELLVVIGALSLLATLGAFFLRSTRRPGCGTNSRAKAQIRTLKAALAMYNADTRQYPRPSTPRTTPETALADAAPALLAALRLPPTQGGGPNSPYLDEPQIGVIVRLAVLQPGLMGSDGRSGVRDLTQQERTGKVGLPGPRVYLDPWGNPFHYREWASVKKALRDDLRMRPPLRTGFGSPRPLDAPLIKQTQDLPHTDTFELWSNGPNGVNEFGDPDSDDVVSWR